MSEKIKATVKTKTKTGKGFQLEGHENWFSANFIMEELAKVNAGDLVEVTYAKKGVFYNVSKIVKVEGETPTSPSGIDTARCKVCGKVLKNPAYPTCWDCKDNVKEDPKIPDIQGSPSTKKEFIPSKYGTPEDIAGKEVGCAANCASQILAGMGACGDIETILETFRVLFEGILTHIRNNK